LHPAEDHQKQSAVHQWPDPLQDDRGLLDNKGIIVEAWLSQNLQNLN